MGFGVSREVGVGRGVEESGSRGGEVTIFFFIKFIFCRVFCHLFYFSQNKKKKFLVLL